MSQLPAEGKIHFGRKVITQEITYKLDLDYVHYAEEGKKTMWAESREGRDSW